MATSLMMAGIIRSQQKDLKKKSVRFALPENLLYLQDRCTENGGRNDARGFWLSPISGAYYDWLQTNAENNYLSHQSDNDVDTVFQDTPLTVQSFQEESNLQLPASPTESMQEAGSLASDATFTVSSPQKCLQCNKLEQSLSSIQKEKDELLEKLEEGEKEITSLRNKVKELEENQKEIESNNKLTLQKVKFLENNLAQGQSEQAQLQVKLAEARAKLTMVLSGKEHLLKRRTKSAEQQEIDAEETKAQMDLLRSEIERLTVSSSRVDVLSSTIQIYKDRITELQKLVESSAKKKVDAEVQVGGRRAIDRWNRTRTKIPLLVHRHSRQSEHDVEDSKKNLYAENSNALTSKRAWLDKEKLITNLREEITNVQYERDRAKDKVSQNAILEERSMEIRLSLENQIRELQEKNTALVEAYRKETILRKKFYNMVESLKGRVRVYCRVRPFIQGELQKNPVCIAKSPDKYTISITTPKGVKEFQFDGVFSQHHSQQDIFKDTEDLVQSVIEGYNVSLFGYGQTGSGKTYTLIGSREEPGIAIRAFYKIFDLIEEYNSKQDFTVSASILELYNDTLIDLLRRGEAQEEKLDIKKYQDGRVYVHGATKIEVEEAEQLMTIFHNACNNRHTSATKMNNTSSRSHLIVTTSVESSDKLTGMILKGKLSVIDLAGSERVGKSAAVANQLKEANSINKSLSALADVIAALITDQSYVPYRNNKLTQLMQDSLGGNSKTLMFVNISPAECNLEETLISLAYASRVKQVTNEALRIQLKSKRNGNKV